MLEIPLFVLVIQIGFNAALNNRGYGSNPLVPTAQFANSRQIRRLADSDRYLSSRASSASYEMPEPEYDSSEDLNFRSLQPVQNLYQRRNNYLRYDAKSENDISLETAPAGRINSNNYAESAQSFSSPSRRTGPNYRRPYFRNGPSSLVQGHIRNNNRKGNDNSSPEVSSLEGGSPDDDSPEESSYLDSLLSLIEESNNGRSQNRKYYRKGNSLSDDASPIDKLDADEDPVHVVPNLNSHNKRRNYRTVRAGGQSDNDKPDSFIDKLLATDKNLQDVGRPKIGNLKLTDIGQANLNNRRRGDGIDLDDDISNNLSPFRGLKPGSKIRKLTNNSPLTRRFNRKSNDNARSSLRDQLFPDDDKTGQLTFLRLSSLEDLNLESPLLRSHDENWINNRKSNSKNFLRLSLSPNNELTLDQGIASDLSELLSEKLDELNLVPVSLRRTGPSSNKYSTSENSAEEDDLTNSSDLRLGSLDIQDYSESDFRRSRNNLRQHVNNRAALKELFDDEMAKTLVPYHEEASKKLRNSRRNGNQNNNRRDDLSDGFSLKRKLILNPDEKESTDILNLEYPWTDALTPSKNKTSGLQSLTESRYGEQENENKDSSDILNLEFPWNDELSPGGNTNDTTESNFRSSKQKAKAKDTTDILHLEYPWNDSLSPDSNKISNQSGLRSKSLLKKPKKKDKAKDTTDVLHLEYPWNDQLSPDNNKNTRLKSPDQEDKSKDTTDILHLEFPWNGELSLGENKSGKSKPLRNQVGSRQDKEPKDELKLEFPWNGETSPEKPANKKAAVRTPDPLYIHPYLRNRNIKKHPNYFRRSYDKFSEGLRLERHRNSLSKQFNRRHKGNQYLRASKSIARAGPAYRKKNSVSVGNPSAVVTFPSGRRHKIMRVRGIRRQNNEAPPLVTTTKRTAASLVNRDGDKNTYNDTIIFPNN